MLETISIPTSTALQRGVARHRQHGSGGKSKLRVVHLSKLAGNVDIWRTQPDFATPTKIQTPFPYLATSPFIQSDSGKWEVFTTAVGSSTKILSSGIVTVPGGGRRTLVLLDVAGAATWRILPE